MKMFGLFYVSKIIIIEMNESGIWCSWYHVSLATKRPRVQVPISPLFYHDFSIVLIEIYIKIYKKEMKFINISIQIYYDMQITSKLRQNVKKYRKVLTFSELCFINFRTAGFLSMFISL